MASHDWIYGCLEVLPSPTCSSARSKRYHCRYGWRVSFPLFFFFSSSGAVDSRIETGPSTVSEYSKTLPGQGGVEVAN